MPARRKNCFINYRYHDKWMRFFIGIYCLFVIVKILNFEEDWGLNKFYQFCFQDEDGKDEVEPSEMRSDLTLVSKDGDSQLCHYKELTLISVNKLDSWYIEIYSDMTLVSKEGDSQLCHYKDLTLISVNKLDSWWCEICLDKAIESKNGDSKSCHNKKLTLAVLL